MKRSLYVLSTLLVLVAASPGVALGEGASQDAPPGERPLVSVQVLGHRLAGVQPMPKAELARRRGGSGDVFNDMQLKGVVTDNRAVNVATGSNWVSEGSLAGAVGIPMLVQNTGNNVLIQNATIINLQLK